MRYLYLTVLLCLCASVTAQTAFMRLTEEPARDLAAAQGTFVIIDFYANWCGPCKTMDDQVWSQDTVQALQRNFVNIRVDASTSNAGLLKYGIKAIPALIVLDANGNEYFRKVGYMKDIEVISLLNKFPADMSKAYASDYVVREQPDAFNSYFLQARHYQAAARTARGSIAGRLAATSSDAIKEAQEVLKQNSSTPASLTERLALMNAENLLLRGRAKKALKAIAALGEELDERNMAHACYVKGMAYRKSGQAELAQDCYDQLQEAQDNEAFLALVAAAWEER